ncbi:apolipophorin-3-like [Choristoneura fumiferana]|uniref:apolipophorin-3-like n=1 Tax=Choristoneura fumiferana TaxID=7141 RepID=UPI003D159A41
MVAKLVVFVAFVALAHGMVRREASTQSPLQEVEKHAAEFQKTITEQWSALLNSKNTQAVNKALKEGSDSVLQQLSQLSTSLQGAISDANGKAKEALETTRANLEKAAAELRKAHPEVEQQAGQLRDRLQAAVSTGVAETQKLAQEVAAHVDQANTKLAPQIKQAYDDFTKQVEVVQKKLHEAANKPQ